MNNHEETINQTIGEKDLFMICFELNQSALSGLPFEYYFRNCRKDELDIWKRIHFDDPAGAAQHHDYMTNFFSRVYASKGDLFYEKCLFACDQFDTPIGTAFIWKAYDVFNTVHWFKVVKQIEGQGLGRALLSAVMRPLLAEDFPVYLHTHPASFRAIKLYSDFGFQLLTNPIIGHRSNDLSIALPYLKNKMPPDAFGKLKMSEAPQEFIRFMDGQSESDF